MKKNEEETLNIYKVNDSVNLLNKILRILYILVILVGLYFLIRLFKELKITNIILVVLKTIAPVFIGLFVAWLFDPVVKYLKKKGIKRGLGALIVYILFIGILILILSALIPTLTEQINDFAKTIPSIFDNIKSWIDGLFDNLKSIKNFDAEGMKEDVFLKIEHYGVELTKSLPTITVDLVKAFFSGIGTFIIGLIIGFYFLIGFDNAGELIATLIPKNLQKDSKDLANEVNTSLRRFVNGALIDSTFVFIITSIAFFIVGLKAPLLFGLFCGLTNIIPYAGPYIGGAPAVIVGLSQNPITGILTLIVIVVIQFLEGNFMQPLIMSKTTKLHPVTIITGLLIFGHFFGILGMALSTPIIAAFKAICIFFNEKYEIVKSLKQ